MVVVVMERNSNIYRWENRLEKEIGRINGIYERKPRKALDQIDIKEILRFHDEGFTQGLSHARIVNYLQRLRELRIFFFDKSFIDCTKTDIKNYVGKIEKSKYSENSKQGYKIAIKKFYQFLRGFEWKSKKYPEEVDWIDTSNNKNSNKLPEELLTQKDVRSLIDGCNNIRDKALISVLYESGCRIGELLSLERKHVQFDKYGATLNASGKTGSRRIRIVNCVPFLANWFENMPITKEDTPLWLGLGTRNKNRGIRYPTVESILNKLKVRIKFKKAVNPHLFRHSRATHLAPHLKEPQMREFFGWSKRSNMPSIYVHLSGRDIDNSILEINGVKEKKVDNNNLINGEALKPIECPICKNKNPPGSSLCKCGFDLTKSFSYQDELNLMREKMEKYEEVLAYFHKEQRKNKI